MRVPFHCGVCCMHARVNCCKASCNGVVWLECSFPHGSSSLAQETTQCCFAHITTCFAAPCCPPPSPALPCSDVGKTRLKPRNFKFAPVRAWLGGNMTEKVEGWRCTVYEATGKVRTAGPRGQSLSVQRSRGAHTHAQRRTHQCS